MLDSDGGGGAVGAPGPKRPTWLAYVPSPVPPQDTQKAKQFLPFLQRAGRSEAVVEYVFSGSRLKLYMPKETCLITFLLAGELGLRWARREWEQPLCRAPDQSRDRSRGAGSAPRELPCSTCRQALESRCRGKAKRLTASGILGLGVVLVRLPPTSPPGAKIGLSLLLGDSVRPRGAWAVSPPAGLCGSSWQSPPCPYLPCPQLGAIFMVQARGGTGVPGWGVPGGGRCAGSGPPCRV